MKARGHKLEEKDLKVVDVVRNQLLLGGLPHCVSEDLKHFVEVRANSGLETVKFGEDGSVAIVTFDEEIGEFQTITHCQERFRVCDVRRETDRQTDGRTDGRTDGQTDGRTDGRSHQKENSYTVFPSRIEKK